MKSNGIKYLDEISSEFLTVSLETDVWSMTLEALHVPRLRFRLGPWFLVGIRINLNCACNRETSRVFLNYSLKELELRPSSRFFRES
jgi:hypothetical protein